MYGWLENLLPQNVGSVILLAVDHNQLRKMAPETVEPIDWSHPPPSWAMPPELHVLHGVNAAYKSQDLLQKPGHEHETTGMPDHRSIIAATQDIKWKNVYFKIYWP